MEHHSFDHMDGLAGEQRTLGPRRRTLAVADGERDIRTRRRGLESQLDQFFKADGAGLHLALARVHEDGDQAGRGLARANMLATIAGRRDADTSRDGPAGLGSEGTFRY